MSLVAMDQRAALWTGFLTLAAWFRILLSTHKTKRHIAITMMETTVKNIGSELENKSPRELKLPCFAASPCKSPTLLEIISFVVLSFHLIFKKLICMIFLIRPERTLQFASYRWFPPQITPRRKKNPRSTTQNATAGKRPMAARMHTAAITAPWPSRFIYLPRAEKPDIPAMRPATQSRVSRYGCRVDVVSGQGALGTNASQVTNKRERKL